MKNFSVLILGSGPNALEARDWQSHTFDKVVAINNAWAVCEDWDDLIFPYDFACSKRPSEMSTHQNFVTQEDFVPIQNKYGGFLYAGGTMAFTAGYWVLGHYSPSQIAFLGCDMHYPQRAPTHFYGKGDPDPLRDDISLRSLEAKANRLYVHAAEQNCVLTNLSSGPSRLTFPRQVFGENIPAPWQIDVAKSQAALEMEGALGYITESGRYWEDAHKFDETKIAFLDKLWLEAVIIM